MYVLFERVDANRLFKYSLTCMLPSMQRAKGSEFSHRKRVLHECSYNNIYIFKQSFNESLDFCNRS